MDTVIQAESGSIGSILQTEIDDDSAIQAFNPQHRTIRTQEVSGGSYTRAGDVCGIESEVKGEKDKGFSLRVDWTGRMGISRLRIFTDQETTPATGKCAASEQGDHRIVNDRGEGIEYEDQE
jgi:hypothetical protein